jgi:hypothetical protein
MVKIIKLPLVLMVFVNAHTYLRIWTRIRNPRVTDPVRILADTDSQY